jgi:hypothetical protein
MTRSHESRDGMVDHDAMRSAREQLSHAAYSAKNTALEYGNHFVAEPAKDLVGLLQDYAKSRPDVAAAWCFGIGLYIGWKLRP